MGCKCEETEKQETLEVLDLASATVEYFVIREHGSGRVEHDGPLSESAACHLFNDWLVRIETDRTNPPSPGSVSHRDIVSLSIERRWVTPCELVKTCDEFVGMKS